MKGRLAKSAVSSAPHRRFVSDFHLKVAFLCAICLVSCLASAVACPGCKEALFEPGKLSQNLATARGYALSIALLLGIPVVLMGTIAVMLVRARRKAAPWGRH